MEGSLLILYTGHLAGALESLPRLQRLLQRLKAETPVAAYCFDLGESCAPDVWHCAATGGRSLLIGLDAMGYQAANISAGLDAAARERLRGHWLRLGLVEPGEAWADERLTAAVDEPPEAPERLWVDLRPAPATRLQGRVLRLAEVAADQVGSVLIDGGEVRQSGVHTVTPDLPPDPTMAGIVDFILAEARLFQQRGK